MLIIEFSPALYLTA